MKLGPLATQFQYSMIALALMSIGSLGALAQEAHSHTMTSSQNEQTAIQKSQASALLKIVRGATDRFHNVAQAEAEGYALQFGCVSGESSGAMGLHFVNGPLVNSGVIDPTKPQIVIYEPTTNGNVRLIGADYLVVADTWNAHHSSPPELMGQLFHLFDTPNRFGLPAFYSLPVLITKRGRPVAKLVPAERAEQDFIGRLEGRVRILGDIESPIEPAEAWEVLR